MTMLHIINLTWEDVFLKHKDAMEMDCNTKDLLDKIPRCGARMEVQQLEVIKTLTGVSLLSQSLGIWGGCLQIHNMDTLNNVATGGKRQIWDEMKDPIGIF